MFISAVLLSLDVMCGINYNITFWRIIRVGLLLLLLIDDDDDDDDAKVRRDASWLDVDTLDMTTRTSSSNHVIAVTSRAWLIDVTRHAARACAFKCVSGVTCFYERRKNCAARLLSTSMTSSGDSTVNCVILILHVKITHCSTNCVNDYINIVVNFSYFRLHRFILGLHHLISFTFFVSVDFCVKSYTFLIVLLHNTIIAYTRTIAVV